MIAAERRTVDPLVGAFLAQHAEFHPVDATFMGLGGYDDRLPRADSTAEADERVALADLAGKLEALEGEPLEVGPRLDLRFLRAQTAIALANLAVRPHLGNPSWYTGEAAFGILSLLLPQSEPVDRVAVRARLAAIPDFLEDGLARLRESAVPEAWVQRAKNEATAFAAFLGLDLRHHPEHDPAWREPAEAAAAALHRFADALVANPDAHAAAGEAHLAFLMRTAHGLDLTPAQAVERAEEAFGRLKGEMEERARRMGGTDAASVLAGLADRHAADPAAAQASFRALHDAAVEAARGLVTPATEYGLDYRPIAPWFEAVSRRLYFLFYRSPPFGRPGRGSVYWMPRPGADVGAYLRANNDPFVKMVHAVHHGSIGHHTQNARARVAASRLARLAGTDCAAGIAFLPAGTMVEGWACYVEDLLEEAPGFYDAAEVLLLRQFERRNAASAIVDVKLHTGEWTAEAAKRFYVEEAGFAAARVDFEVTRNGIFPATRLMYWLGTEAIKDLRRRWTGDPKAFHDTLLGYGHLPVAWAGEEMARAGQLRGEASSH